MQIRRVELAARRKVCGLSQESLADTLKVDRTTVTRWEVGSSSPLPWVRPRLADALGVTVEELSILLDEASPSTPQLRGDAGVRVADPSLVAAATPWTLDGGLSLLKTTAGDAVLDRRDFLVLSAGAAVGIAQDWLTINPPAVASALGGGRIDVGLVATLEERLPALRRIDHTLGGGSVRTLADAELQLVTNLLRSSSYDEPLGRRLFAIAAELGRVAGWASCDLGQLAAAERYWVAGLHAAHLCVDRGIGANILKSMSLQRAEAGQSVEALSLAEAARKSVQGSGGQVRAMLTVRQARIHASRGERADCERLLSQAETLLSSDSSQQSPSPTWAQYFDEAEFNAQVAASYLLLKDHARADEHLGQALACQPDERSRDRGTYSLWRAETLLGMGEVEEACHLVTGAIPDLAVARSDRNRRRLTKVRMTMRPFEDQPAVRDLDERLIGLTAA